MKNLRGKLLFHSFPRAPFRKGVGGHLFYFLMCSTGYTRKDAARPFAWVMGSHKIPLVDTKGDFFLCDLGKSVQSSEASLYG